MRRRSALKRSIGDGSKRKDIINLGTKNREQGNRRTAELRTENCRTARPETRELKTMPLSAAKGQNSKPSLYPFTLSPAHSAGLELVQHRVQHIGPIGHQARHAQP